MSVLRQPFTLLYKGIGSMITAEFVFRSNSMKLTESYD